MDRTVIWSSESLDDIDSIAEFISRDSIHHAQQIVSRLFELELSIAENPLIGRIVPEFGNATIRERFLYSFRVIYEIQEDEIFILAVIHGKRLLESAPQFSHDD